MPIPPISEASLVQVARVVNAIARTEVWRIWETIEWLAARVDESQLKASLHQAVRHAGGSVVSVDDAASRVAWRSLARLARARNTDQNQMPPAASSWWIRADDLAVFADHQQGLSDQAKDALLDLAMRHGARRSSLAQPAAPVPIGRKPRVRVPPAGLVYWRHVLYDNVEELDKQFGGRAKAKQAIAFLKGLNDARLPAQGAADELWWRDDIGDKFSVKGATVRNALIDARKWVHATRP